MTAAKRAVEQAAAILKRMKAILPELPNRNNVFQNVMSDIANKVRRRSHRNAASLSESYGLDSHV